MTTTTTTTTAPAAPPVLRWAARSLRWGGRKLTTSRDVLLWAAGFTNPAPFPGTGMLGDATPSHHRHPTTKTKPPAERRKQPRTNRGKGHAVTGLQQRLVAAITAGPPGGGTWTGRALAEHIGCARSTAWAALNAHRQRSTAATRTKKAASGNQQRSRGRQPTGRADRER